MTPEEIVKENEALKTRVKELTKETDEKSPESIYSITYNTNGGGMLVTVRSRPGESGESYLYRFNTMLEKLGAMGYNVKQATPANSAPDHAQAANVPPPTQTQAQPQQANGNGGGQSFPAKTLTATVADGKTFWKIKGGMWEKWGITVYPEVLTEAGFGELNPLQTYDLTNWTAHYSLKDDGKPQKVTRLTR